MQVYGDEVFLLEYLLPDEPQFGLAKYIKAKYPYVKVYALSHLTETYFEQSIVNKRAHIICEWSRPIDKMLTLGSSLSEYFKENHVPEDKIVTGFHYVDSDYYHADICKATVHNPLTVISMGMMQRDYSLLINVVRKCPNVKWIICRGLKKVDHLFEGISNVELKGFMPEAELRDLMSKADISLNIMEDTVGSNVITTSMSMGLGLVVTDVGSIRDYCDEKNACFCKNDVDSLVSAINKLSNDGDKVISMKKYSLEYSKRFHVVNVHKWFCSLRSLD